MNSPKRNIGTALLMAAVSAAAAVALALAAGPAGAQWFQEARLTYDISSSYTPPNNSWAVACDGAGNVHVVWFDTRDGNAEIYFKMFDGAAWTPDERLTYDASTSGDPSVAAYGDRRVHVVWHDGRDGNFEIYHKAFDGSAWSADERLTSAANTSWNPAVAVGPDSSVHVVWHDTRDGFVEIYYKKYDGGSWGPDTRLTVDTHISQNPCVAADPGGNVHVVWNDFRYENSKIYYKKHDGVSWGPDTRLTDTPHIAQRPCIAAGPGGTLHVVWEDYRDSNYEIYYKQFDGSSWSADTRLTGDPAVSGAPSIAAGPDGRLHVVWHDKRTPSYHIYYKRYNGSAWEADYQITFDAGDSKYPSIAVAADSVLHAVWQDRRDDNWEIYWTRTYPAYLPPPELSYVRPDSGYWGITVHVDSLVGANFLFEVDVYLQREGDPDVHAANVVVHSSELVTCDLNLWEAAVGYWDLVLENGDGKKDTLADGFRVLALADLEVYAIEPDSGVWAGVVHIDSITGDGFNDSTRVRLEKSGEPDLIPRNVSIYSPHKITCDLDLMDVLPGYWDLIVANPDGQADTIPSAFRVIGLKKPVVYSITPDEGKAGESVRITDLSGEEFTAPARAWLACGSEPEVFAVNVAVESPNTITCDLHLPIGASGTWDVVVENPDRQSDTLYSAFRIFPGPWSADRRISWGEVGALTSTPGGRCIAADRSDNLHVVWYDSRSGTPEIYYRKHDGLEWGAEERLTESSRGAEYPCVAVDSAGSVHVVWTDLRDNNWEIYYKMHDGTAWSSNTRLTTAPGDSRMPAVAADAAGRLHVVWYDTRLSEWDVFYKMYDGAWSADTLISESGPYAYSALPAVAVDESLNVHVAWYDSRHGGDEIYYRRMGAAGWEPEVRISSAAGDSWSPSVAAAGGKVYISWHDSRYGGYEIMFRAFDGTAWGPEQRITSAPGVSGNSCLALDRAGKVHLVWHDERHGDAEIYYNRFDGARWTGDLRLTTAAEHSRRPFIACDSTGRLHIVWQDAREGCFSIYYKTKDPEDAAGIKEDARAETLRPLIVTPNPAADGARLYFSLAAAAPARVMIYDVAGRLIWGVDLGRMEAGPHQVAWDGLDRDGRPVSTGIYFARVICAGTTHTAKLVVLR